MSADHNSSSTPHHEQFENEEQAAKWWLENVYQGDNAIQLTPRAVITGMLIGGVMSISNLYVGLYTGWGLGVTITSCIIAYAVFRGLESVLPAFQRRPFTVLENYTMSSAASAAGYMSSAGLVSALPALLMITGEQLPMWQLMLWMTGVSALGVFMAIPLKRNLINVEQLPFPSGIATAETLRSMHSSGAEAITKARALFCSGIVGALVGFFRKATEELGPWLSNSLGLKSVGEFVGKLVLPGDFPLLSEDGLKRYPLAIPSSLIMLAAGAIMGIRVGASLILGSVVFFFVLGPWLMDQGIVVPGSKLADLPLGKVPSVTLWSLWPATTLMVVSGLLSFALRWKTVVRALSGLVNLVSSNAHRKESPLDRVEVPASWFVTGTLVSGTACIVMGHFFFQIEWWMGLLAVLLTFILAVVAARATGETDITPVGAMGKITQLSYGVIAPSNTTTNLMTACITAGASSHAADLLSDLKSGYLLGGNPRKQTISQLFGIISGTLICVPVYLAIVTLDKLVPAPGAEKAEIPAVAAQTWKAVANLLAQGPKALPTGAVTAVIVAALIGIAITLLEELGPKSWRKWIPSATGLGIAGVVGFDDSLAMFVGALIAWSIMKTKPSVGETYTVPVSSGIIAGQSLTEAFVAVTKAVAVLIR